MSMPKSQGHGANGDNAANGANGANAHATDRRWGGGEVTSSVVSTLWTTFDCCASFTAASVFCKSSGGAGGQRTDDEGVPA